MDPPHSLYHLITELRTVSLPCFIGNFTIRFHSSTGRSLWEETSNVKRYFVGRFAVGSGSLSKTLLGQGYLQETCEAYHSWCKQLGNTCKWPNMCGIWMFRFQVLDNYGDQWTLWSLSTTRTGQVLHWSTMLPSPTNASQLSALTLASFMYLV